jgi:hypothetical protein
MLRVYGEYVIIAVAKGIGILLALFSVVASPAAFTPAVLLAFLLMCISGLAGWLGHLKWAIATLAISSVAVGISPVTDMDQFGHSMFLAMLYSLPVVFGFGGVILGVYKLQRCQNT